MRISHGVALVMAAVALTLAMALCVAVPARADESLEELQARVEQTSSDYNSALEQVEKLEADMQVQQGKIDEIEATLPEKRDEAAGAIRSLYKLQQSAPGLMGLILSSDDFNEFISLVQYLDIIQAKQIGSVQELVDAQRELEAAQEQLAFDKAAADDQLAAAETALSEAQSARAEAQRRAEAELAAQAAAAQAAVEAAQRAQAEAAAQAEQAAEQQSEGEAAPQQDDSATIDTNSGGTADVEVPDDPVPDPVPMADDDRSQFVAKWQPRIDAYLAGSPLGGYGRVFAEAAWDYGVDPRVSPAIACIESGKGAICFRPHNAWGWGSVSWGSWDSAIRGHVSGFASIYGYTLTPSGAEMYCPGTGGLYYSSVVSQMSCI